MEMSAIKLGDNEPLYEKVLGIFWNTETDKINFKVKELECSENPTKRNVLSTIMRVYDPLGLISNITIQGKMFMQKLWKWGLDELHESWNH